MNSIRQYLLSVIIAAIICGILSSFTKNLATKEVIRFLIGVFFAFTILRPFVHLDVMVFSEISHSFSSDTENITAEGTNMTHKAMCDIIKAETEAYILDKAAALDLDIIATITVDGEEIPIPVAVSIGGEISSSTKEELARIIEKDLGISKENQQWTG